MSLGACPRLVPVMVICVPPLEGPAVGVNWEGEGKEEGGEGEGGEGMGREGEGRGGEVERKGRGRGRGMISTSACTICSYPSLTPYHPSILPSPTPPYSHTLHYVTITHPGNSRLRAGAYGPSNHGTRGVQTQICHRDSGTHEGRVQGETLGTVGPQERAVVQSD